MLSLFFCRRAAGKAAEKSGNWSEAERYFLLGAEKAKHSDVQKSMGIGLLADVAFALWKQKHYKDSLSLFADTLDLLATIPISEDIRIRHLHATVRHCISWIHFDARSEHSVDIVEPLPGMCSNQEPHEGIKDFRIIDISAAWELLASTEDILQLNIGIKTRSQIATGGRKSLLVAGYERTLAFDLLFKRTNFENLIPVLIAMLEGLHHSKILQGGQDDVWAIGDVPKLPDGYWENPANRFCIYIYALVASVICTADNQDNLLPIERWRADLAKVGALAADVEQFLNVLNGLQPDESLYQQAAAAICALRRGTLAPVDLWTVSFRLLNALMNEKRWIETALEGLLIPRWLFATNNQRFAFSTPSLSCPEIEKCCLDRSLSGLAKIAAVLAIAAPYLRMRLSTDAKQMIERIIKQV